MIDQDGLNVWYEKRLVGYLWRNDIDYIGFRYDDQWVVENGFAISRTLPLQTEAFTEVARVAHKFFANLLPEGGAREHVVRDLKIPNTDFDLLRAIGGECAGALSILSVEDDPAGSYTYQELNATELGRLVSRRGQLYANQAAGDRPRLSLAGAQDKCAVLFKDGTYFNPMGDAPSTHILKFESAEYRNLPVYETYTLMLAEAVQIPVVDISLCKNGKRKFARIARYDRRIDENQQVRRLHQEDFCQAMGYSHTRKYQHDGGPTFRQCLDLLRDASDDPATDTRLLLRWQIFNVLAGNSDGHAKNLSLLYHADGSIRLTVFYDLICTRAIERIDENLAFDVGGKRDPKQVTRDDWRRFAVECDVGAKFLFSLLDDTVEQLLLNVSDVREKFEALYGCMPALERIEKIVRKQCSRVAIDQ